MHKPRVGVVTVSHNSSAEVQTFLQSLDNATTEPPTVVIADNLSSDWDSLASVAAAANATAIRLGENRGYGSGVNAGYNALGSDCDFILVSNPDVIMHPGSLDKLVAYLISNPSAGAAGPRIVDAAGDTYPSARRLPSLFMGTAHALLARSWPTNPWTRKYHNLSDDKTPRTAGWLSGACVLIRREAFEAVNGFDDSFFMYFEDVDLGRRLTAAGWKNVYVPQAVVTHTGAHSTATNSERMLAAHHRSAFLYVSRQYPHWYQAPLRAAVRAGLEIRRRPKRRTR